MKPIRSHRIVQPNNARRAWNYDGSYIVHGVNTNQRITGLMIRQIIARKLGASESYQQMAENAAINGFNRILGEVNRDDKPSTKVTFTLRNDEQGWGWRNPNSTDFPLMNYARIPRLSLTADPLSDSTEAVNQYCLAVPMLPSQAKERMEKIIFSCTTDCGATHYQGMGGADEGTFQIEGIVQRSSDQNNDNSYLARTPSDTLAVHRPTVAGAGDWAVLGGYHMQLGDIDIMGDKRSCWINDAAPYQKVGCSRSTLLNKVGL